MPGKIYEELTVSTPIERSTWPQLPVKHWQDTRDTVHLWTQIVGKVRLALTPRANHWWNVPLYVNSVGLTTSLMPWQGRGVEITFDFTAHTLIIATTNADRRQIVLEPRSVADFYAEFRSHLDELGIDVAIYPVPVELVEAIPFADDTVHASYDADAMHDFWISLVDADRVFRQFRSQFRGKASPVHFFWGAFDLAVTRFSGRPATPHPGGVPNCPDWVMQEAYSDEVSSCGYWPGGADEGAFYAYAYPEPPAFPAYPLEVEGASYDDALGEFVLPYTLVRTAADPDDYLLRFLNATYLAAARSAQWPYESLRGARLT
jgi:Family of unknown function (DUF5996)